MRHGTTLRLAVASLVVGLATFSTVVVSGSVAGAIAPGYGEGSGFCATVTSSGYDLGGNYDNVFACGPIPGASGEPGYGDAFEGSPYGFQCTELANRFLWDAWGISPVFGDSLDGANFASTVASERTVPLIPNGTAGQPYVPGDVVSFTDGGDGHVAVVIASREDSNGNGTVTLMEEDASSTGQTSASVSNWSMGVPSGSDETPSNFDALASPPAPSVSPPAVGVDGAGNQYVYWQGANGSLWEDWYVVFGPTSGWYGPANLNSGTMGSGPTVGVHSDGEQDVFWKGTDGNLYEMDYSGGWNGPFSLGSGPLDSAPSVGVDGAGNQYVYWQGANGSLWEDWYAGGGWNGPANLSSGTMGSGPTVAVHADGQQDVFWKGVDGNLYEMWYANGWNGPVSLGNGPLGSTPSAGVDGSGNQFVYWQGANGSLWEAWYAGGAWNGPANLSSGTMGSGPTVGVHPNGEQDVFWKGVDGNLYEMYYSGGWNGPVRISGGSHPATVPPAITSAGSASFVSGSVTSFTVTTTGFPTSAVSEVGALPQGVSFTDNGDGTASVAGTPATGTSGTYPITISASNGVPPDATQGFTLTVLPIGITTTSLPSGTVGTAYTATLTANGGNPPYKWSLASGSSPLPPGLKLKSTGVISGKPKKAGTYSFTVQVIDTKTKTKPHPQNRTTQILSITIL